MSKKRRSPSCGCVLHIQNALITLQHLCLTCMQQNCNQSVPCKPTTDPPRKQVPRWVTPTSTFFAPLQEEVLHWGPAFFSQDGAQPLVYVVVLLMSQHFRKAVEYMGDLVGLREHGTHMAIACNHLKVSCCILLHARLCCFNHATTPYASCAVCMHTCHDRSMPVTVTRQSRTGTHALVHMTQL